MAYYDYESELNPLGPDLHETDWYTDILLSLPTDRLQEKYRETLEQLEQLRQQEPARKRCKKSDYRAWVRRTHDLIDRLDNMADELKARQAEIQTEAVHEHSH